MGPTFWVSFLKGTRIKIWCGFASRNGELVVFKGANSFSILQLPVLRSRRTHILEGARYFHEVPLATRLNLDCMDPQIGS